MQKLEEIRAKYPQYADISDAELAGKLYSKFYSDMPKTEFMSKIGVDIGFGSSATGQFFEGFNRGLYSMANAPTSLANMATSALGIDYQFKRPLEAIAPELDREAMEMPEPASDLAKVTGRIGEFTGANALPAMGTIAAAPRIAAATANATGLTGQVVNQTARGIAAAPGTAAAGEALSSVGSGVGASMAEGSGPMGEYLAATAGGILAPMGLALSPANMARKAVGAAKRRFSPEEVAKQQRRQMVDGLRQNITDEGRKAIDDTLDIQRNVPGYKPSVAEATENPSLITTQREFESGLSGPYLDAAARRYSTNDEAIRRAIAAQAPESDFGVDDAFATGARRISNVTSKIDKKVSGLNDAASRVSDSIKGSQRRRELGASIREDLINARTDMKGEMSIAAGEMGLNDPSPRYAFQQVKERLKRAAEPRSKLADRDAIPSRLLSDVEKMDDNASIVDLMELRSRIGADIREASRTPTGEKRVPYLQAMKAELDAATDQIVRATGDDTLADHLTKFRQMYRDDFVAPFEQGASARVLKTDANGAYVVPDEKVAKEFFDGWGQTSADQFNKIFPRSANARAAMEDVSLDDLHSFAVRDGTLNPSLIDAWKRKNGGVLSDFPEISKKITDTESAIKAIEARRATLLARKTQAEKSILAREVARIESGSTTPDAVVTQAISNPRRMMRLMSGVKAPEAKAAIARKVWETALSSNKPLDFLEKSKGSIRVALGQEKFKSAMRLARAIEKNSLVSRPQGQGLDTNPFGSVEAVMGTGLNQISSRVFAVKSGRTSARYALADVFGRSLRQMSSNNTRKFLSEALYDPQIAADLSNAIQYKIMTPASAKRLHTFMISNGIVAAQNDE